MLSRTEKGGCGWRSCLPRWPAGPCAAVGPGREVSVKVRDVGLHTRFTLPNGHRQRPGLAPQNRVDQGVERSALGCRFRSRNAPFVSVQHQIHEAPGAECTHPWQKVRATGAGAGLAVAPRAPVLEQAPTGIDGTRRARSTGESLRGLGVCHFDGAARRQHAQGCAPRQKSGDPHGPILPIVRAGGLIGLKSGGGIGGGSGG